MKILKPRYYDAFQCIASQCPDSCCKEWDVQVDPVSAQRYRSLEGPLGDRLRKVMEQREEDVVMVQENGRCPMWMQNGLCRIHGELGEDALCEVCRAFPRLRHDYGDFVELGLELSCPEAARLIFEEKSEPWVLVETEETGEGEYDPETMDILKTSRTKALALMQDMSIPVNHALAVLLLYGYSVQEQIDGGGEIPLDVQALLEQAESFRQEGDEAAVLAFLEDLEILTDAWRQRLQAPQGDGGWDGRLRSLAAYAIGRYWLQAVSDFDIVCRVKLIILFCLAAKILGGDPEQTAQLMSKEIENNLDNVEMILDGAYTAPALTDVRLLDMLLKS